MDIRRFFNNKTLNESLSSNQRVSLFEDTFAELNRLYEADEQPKEANDVGNSTGNSIDEIKKEVQNVEIPDIGIKLEGKADELYDQLVAKLQQSKLASAVEILQTVAADDKLSKLLKHGFSSESKEDNQIQVDVKPDVSLETKSLVPTQNVVVVSNSLDNLVNGYFMTKDAKSGEKVPNNIDYTKYFSGDAPVPQPFVYQAGGQNYIIDGHHRWSQAYCMNPYGTVKCTVVIGPAISADAALKNFQAAIAVDDSTKQLPIGSGSGQNLFKVNVQELGKTVAPMSEETADKIVAAGKDSKAFKNINPKIKQAFSKGSENLQAAKALLVSNALTLKNTVSPGSNEREIMPQADIKKVTAILNNGAMPINK
jgi:hypothetical protein